MCSPANQNRRTLHSTKGHGANRPQIGRKTERFTEKDQGKHYDRNHGS